MDHAFKQSVWKQFGASIDMLENAINRCPEELWARDPKFWYLCYHVLFFLDFYLTPEPEKFHTPEPFTMSEMEDTAPDRKYTKEEVLGYVRFCREKCRQHIAGWTDEIANRLWTDGHKTLSVYELSLYNMRHVQHHAAQLNMLLRQNINDAPKWVRQTKRDL